MSDNDLFQKVAEGIERRTRGFAQTLGVHFTKAEKGHVEATMSVENSLLQPHGFLHGGATIALLETVASLGAELLTDLNLQRPFGTDIHVRHRNSVREGTVTGVAELAAEEEDSHGNIDQTWSVVAHDEAGMLISEGTVVVKIVTLEYLAQRNARKGMDRS